MYECRCNDLNYERLNTEDSESNSLGKQCVDPGEWKVGYH
jgi:hypothetical protein